MVQNRYNEADVLAQTGCPDIAAAVLKLKAERAEIKRNYGENSREFQEIHTLIRKIRRNAPQSINQYAIYVGRKYENFVEEAKKEGVSRAVPKNVAHQYFGKAIALATWDSTAKEATVFGYFVATRFNIVMDKAEADRICKEHDIQPAEVDMDIERECGKYTVTLMVSVSADTMQIFLDEADRIMIGGDFVEIEPEVVTGVTFTRGVAEFPKIAAINPILTDDQLAQIAVCQNYVRNF